MLDLTIRPIPKDDGVTHINTHPKAKRTLGKLLAPSHDIGEPIHHPLIGHFRSIDNLWCYLNTGGNRDNIRTMEPHVARNFTRLTEDKYSCDKFWQLTLDLTILKLQTHSNWEQLMIDEELPFDHYYLKGPAGDRIAIRPKYAASYIEVLEDAREILRGNKEHKFVSFRDLNFKKLEN